MDLKERLLSLANAAVKAPDHFVVDVIISGRNAAMQKVMVIVDGDNGVTIDDCAEISRRISEALDAQDFIEQRYMLEVSTPGLDHPLSLKRQFPKNIGRQLKVHTTDKKMVQGKLAQVSDGGITLEVEEKTGKKKELSELHLSYAQIEKAFVMVSFK